MLTTAGADEGEEGEGREDWLEQKVVDFEKLEESIGQELSGCEVGFCCLGTTRKQAGSDAAFRKVDHEYVRTIATLAK